MASAKQTKAQRVAEDEAQLEEDTKAGKDTTARRAQLAADQASTDEEVTVLVTGPKAGPAADSVDGASAEARKQQLANTAAKQQAADEAEAVAKEVAVAKEKLDLAQAEHVAAQARHSLALANASAAGSKPLVTPDGMMITAAGLPNSCTVCGKKIDGDLWYARSEDAARAGVGYCADDAQKQSDKLKAQKDAAAPVGPRTFGEKSVANQTEQQAKEDAQRK